MDIEIEKAKLSKLRAEMESAQSSYNSQLERDAIREDGSPRQDAMHEQILRSTRDRANSTSAAFAAQKKLLDELLAR